MAGVCERADPPGTPIHVKQREQTASDDESALGTSSPDKLKHFLAGKGGLLRAMPVILATGAIYTPGASPTSLDVDYMLKHNRVYALTEARALYGVDRLVGADGSSSNIEFVGPKRDDPDMASIVAISRRDGAAIHGIRRLVSKVALLECMPNSVASAYRSLLEMNAGVAATGRADVVSAKTVAAAARILFRPADDVPGMAEADIEALVTRDWGDEDLNVGQESDCDVPGGSAPGTRTPDPDRATVGEAYFFTAHIVAALRLYVRLCALTAVADGTTTVDDDDDDDDEDVIAAVALRRAALESAFEPFIELGRSVGLTCENVEQYSISPAVRLYSHERNAEFVNEVVAGMRVTQLFHSRIAVGFTPVVDYFATRSLAGPKHKVLHVVSARNDATVTKTIYNVCYSGLSPAAMCFVRSVMAQVLLSLEAAQYHAQFSHYDLHTSNVMLQAVDDSTPERRAAGVVWQYTRPESRGGLFLPSGDSTGLAVRMIDFGRARMADPRRPNDDKRVSYIDLGHEFAPRREFSASADMRAFAHDLVLIALEPWHHHMHAAVQARALGDMPDGMSATAAVFLCALVDLAEIMTALGNWEGWVGDDAARYNTTDGGPLEMPKSFEQYLGLVATMKVSNKTFKRVRDWEFVTHRPATEPTQSPIEVLDHMFFDGVRNAPDPASGVDVIQVADASTSLGIDGERDLYASSQRKQAVDKKRRRGSVDRG